jgi:aminoglycoside phosphotransferase (APT) family kinase protein
MGLFTLEDVPPGVAKHLPTRASIDYPTQGMTSDVAFVTGVEGSVVVKRCGHAIYLDWLRREHSVLRALASLELPVPAVVGYAEVAGSAGPEGWLVMSRLRGRSLWSAMLESRPIERMPVFRRLGRLLRDLHSTALPGAIDRDTGWLSRKLLEAENNLAWCDGTAAMLASLRLARPEPAAEVLIHGDLSLDNVLIAEDGELSLIDWSDGGRGDYRSDIALALSTEPEIALSEKEVAAFYDGYGCEPIDRQTRLWFERLYEFF